MGQRCHCQADHLMGLAELQAFFRLRDPKDIQRDKSNRSAAIRDRRKRERQNRKRGRA